MGRNLALLVILSLLFSLWDIPWSALGGKSADDEKCLLTPSREMSPGETGRCLPAVSPIGYGVSLYGLIERDVSSCQVLLRIRGEHGSFETNLKDGVGLMKKEAVVLSKAIGNVIQGSMFLTQGNCQISCSQIEVAQSHAFWLLDCSNALRRKGDSIDLYLAGSKPYRITLTSFNENDDTKNDLLIQIIGKLQVRTKPLSLFSTSRNNQLLYQTVMYATDVGEISAINITNITPNHPFRFKTLLIHTDDGNVGRFNGGGWIGVPFSSSAVYTNGEGVGETSTKMSIDCMTRLSDIVSGEMTDLVRNSVKVTCPSHCDEASLVGKVAGLTIHPASSSICLAGIVDGVMSASSGGDLALIIRSLDDKVFTPVLKNVTSLIQIFPYRSVSVSDKFSFVPILLESDDDIHSVLRIVDQFGRLSHTGRLEIRRGNQWGSVCNHASTKNELNEDSSTIGQTTNEEAAKIACRELGYMFGQLLSKEGETCSSIDGQFYCGTMTSPIASGPIVCEGDEEEFGQCKYFEFENSSNCLKHEGDVIVRCTDHPPFENPPAGALRIVDSSGVPTVAGRGRLEMWTSNYWSSICDDKWDSKDAAVACRTMGYDLLDSQFLHTQEQRSDATDGSADGPGTGSANTSGGSPSATASGSASWSGATTDMASFSIMELDSAADDSSPDCSTFLNSNYCGDLHQRISVTDVDCEGEEANFKECPMVVQSDVYCVHSEDVVIACSGADGDPSGIGLYKNDELPNFKILPFRDILSLSCEDDLIALKNKIQKNEKTLLQQIKPDGSGPGLAMTALLPGTVVMTVCPSECDLKAVPLSGTDIYTPSSSICAASRHSLLKSSTFLTLIGHGQTEYSGSERNGIKSTSSSSVTMDSFVVLPTFPEIFSKIPGPSMVSSENIGDGSLGFSGTSKLSETFLRDRETSKRPKDSSFEQREASAQNSLNFLQVFSGFESNYKSQIELKPIIIFCNKEDSNRVVMDGKTEISLTDLPNGSMLNTLEIFTLFIKFSVNEKSMNKWRSLISFSECEGFALSIDTHNEIVFAQECTPHVIFSNFFVNAGVSVSLTVTVSSNSVRFYNYYTLVSERPLDFSIVPMSSDVKMTAGLSSILSYEPLIGDISNIFVFDYPIDYSVPGPIDYSVPGAGTVSGVGTVSGAVPAPETVSNESAVHQLVDNIETICSMNKQPQHLPSFSDFKYRMCLTDCEKTETVSTRLKDQVVTTSSSPLVYLDCSSTLDNTASLSAQLGQVIKVLCPFQPCTAPDSSGQSAPEITDQSIESGLDAVSEDQSIGAKERDTFGSNVPICGSIETLEEFRRVAENQYVKIQVVPDQAEIRAFKILGLGTSHEIDCDRTASFIAFKSPINSKHIVFCPHNCTATSAEFLQQRQSSPESSLMTSDRSNSVLFNSETPICAAARAQGLIGKYGGHVFLQVHRPDANTEERLQLPSSFLATKNLPSSPFSRSSPSLLQEIKTIHLQRSFALLPHPGALHCQPDSLNTNSIRKRQFLKRRGREEWSLGSKECDPQNLVTGLIDVSDFVCDNAKFSSEFEVPYSRPRLTVSLSPSLFLTIDRHGACEIRNSLDDIPIYSLNVGRSHGADDGTSHFRWRVKLFGEVDEDVVSAYAQVNEQQLGICSRRNEGDTEGPQEPMRNPTERKLTERKYDEGRQVFFFKVHSCDLGFSDDQIIVGALDIAQRQAPLS